MVIIGLAVGADNHVRVLGVEAEASGDVDDSSAATLACQALLTTRGRCKDVVGVHRADDQVASIPGAFAGNTLDVITTLQTCQAGSIQEL